MKAMDYATLFFKVALLATLVFAVVVSAARQ